jgi:hypothetical protein
MFMKGTYLSNMVPQFGGVRNFSQKLSTTSEGCKEETKHSSEKVYATSITMCLLLNYSQYINCFDQLLWKFEVEHVFLVVRYNSVY